jgi:hypothetical protein
LNATDFMEMKQKRSKYSLNGVNDDDGGGGGGGNDPPLVSHPATTHLARDLASNPPNKNGENKESNIIFWLVSQIIRPCLTPTVSFLLDRSNNLL